MAAERSIKLRLEAEVSQYKKALDDAAQSTENLAASQDLAAKKVEHAAAAQRAAADKVKAAEDALKKVRADSSSSADQLSKAEQAVTKAKLDDTQASQTLRDAERGLTEAKLASAEASLKQETRMGRFKGFIEDNAAGVQAAGTIMVAFGGAITGVGLAAIKTGIEYNTLQQTTRKALTTLTGSAEEANAQMDKLDAFARTSPFAKGVFIESQQQMLAFGIETNKVIPYLSALNDAVAAAGGNSQTIGELSLIMAQISASSKITATDLMQFGKRGIDAATLIGSQMDMTGAQIRDSITAGTLDANDALDALAAGMSETYAGAAAGVKDTFAGAIDRMKASWREFGAMLAEPLVSQQGGGILVDLANTVADLGNAFRDLPDPIRNTILVLTGVIGVGSLLTGTFALAAPRLIATHDALTKLVGAKITGGLTTFAKGAGLAGVALAALYALDKWTGHDVVEADVSAVTSALIDLSGGSKTASEALDGLFQMDSNTDAWKLWEQQTQGVDGFGDALRRVADPTFAEKANKALSWMPLFNADNFNQASSDIEALDGSLAQMVASGNAEQAERAWAEIIVKADELGISTEDLTELFPGYAAALKEAENQTRLNADATEEAATWAEKYADAMQEQSDAADAAWEAMNRLTNGVLDSRSAERAYLDSIEAVSKALEDNGKTLDVNTVKGRANQEVLDNIVSKGLAHVDTLREQGASYEELQGAMGTVRDDLIEQAERFGLSTDEAKALANELELFPDEVTAKMDLETREAIEKTRYLEKLLKDAGENLDDWQISADGTSAIRTKDDVKAKIDKTTGVVKIDGKDGGAGKETKNIRDTINKTHAYVPIGGKVTQGGYNSLYSFRSLISKPVTVPLVAGPQPVIPASTRARFPGIFRNADGGRAGVGSGLPAFAGGGRLPSTGLGTDQILGINSMGLPTAWVDDREWIINSRSSDKYDNLLNAINQDSPSVRGLAGYAGGGTVQAIPAGVPAGTNAGFDYDKLASAISRVSNRDVQAVVTAESAQVIARAVGGAAESGVRKGMDDAGGGISTLVRAGHGA